jgi:hypothetical protein
MQHVCFTRRFRYRLNASSYIEYLPGEATIPEAHAKAARKAKVLKREPAPEPEETKKGGA